MSASRMITVDTRPNPYPVYIEAGGLDSLGAKTREVTRARQALVITDSNVGPLYGARALDSLRQAEFEPTLVTVPAGEPSKSLKTVAELYDTCARLHMDRTSPAISLGGGVIGDLTGFVAATWQRGIPFIQCSTTVEADVDASVGGKTAVNHASGKNMVGSFYQPRFVLIDPETLSTLSMRDYLAGLAESIKHAVIRDEDFFVWHEEHVESLRTRQLAALPELLERNVKIKADIVAQDEREITGTRALLNFGHTIGHAIESALARRDDPWRHGECVAVGMVAACEMSVIAGHLDRASGERVVQLIAKMGLPVAAPLDGSTYEELRQLIRADKKVAAGKIRFVLANQIGSAALFGDIEPAWIEAGLERVVAPVS